MKAPRKYRLFGPATGGAMTATGGGATEHYNLSGASGNPISDRLARDGQLQAGSPSQIPAPGGQPGVSSRKDKDKNNSTAATGSAPAPVTSATGVANSGGSAGGGGGFGGGGGARQSQR